MSSVKTAEPGLRIGIDATDLSIRNFKGGVYRYTVSLLSALRDIDSQNRYTLFFNYFYRHHRLYCEEAMQILRGPNMRPRLSRFPRTLRKRFHLPVNLFIGKVDVFHGPFDNLLPVFGCRKIVTIHDLRYFDIHPRLMEVLPELAGYPLDSPTFKGWDDFMNGMRGKVASTVEKADFIIAVSDSTKGALMKHLGVGEDKIRVVHNGYSPRFSPRRDAVEIRRVKNKYAIGDEFFLFVGQMDPFKNLTRILDAWKIHKDGRKRLHPRLVIVTPTSGSYWFSEILQRKIRSLSLEEDVLFLRDLPDEDLPVLYGGSTALLLPSLYEGFGFPALEAMACGTPVIASRVCSLPEVVGNAALMVDPYSPASIADAMERVRDDAHFREDMIERGIERAKLFSWERSARETLDVYRLASRS